MHSHISLVQGGHRKYLVELDQSACARLHNTRTFVYGQGSIISDLLPNTTNYRTLTLAGTTHGDGTCYGSQFTDGYGTWTDVVVEASIYISFKDYYTPVKTKQDVLLLRSGTHCRASELACIDEDGSNVYWGPLPNDKCQFYAYEVLYQGFATKIIDPESRYPTVYTVTSEQTAFALSKKSERTVCGYNLIQTDHPKLVVVETSRDNPFAKQARILTENLDSFLYLNTKITYIEKHIKKQLQNLYRNVIDQKCSLEKQVLQNAIVLAFNQPDLFAYTVMKGPGYVATLAGEVAHITKCVPVDVARRPTDSCFLELPVTLGNHSMFLAPKTRILLRTGTPIDCNPLIPTMYNVGHGWMSLTPKPAATMPPQMLEPLVRPTWKYTDAEHLAESGIYSTEDLNRLREHIMFPIEQPTIINNFAKAAAGHRIPPGGISIANLLDDTTLDIITQSTGERLFGGFLQFGTVSAGLIGIWMIIKVIKTMGDTLIHGYALHSVYGWSVHLLGAVFSSITSLLLHLGRRPREESPSTPSANSASAPTSSSDPLPGHQPTPYSRRRTSPAPCPRPPLTTDIVAIERSLDHIEERLNRCIPTATPRCTDATIP